MRQRQSCCKSHLPRLILRQDLACVLDIVLTVLWLQVCACLGHNMGGGASLSLKSKMMARIHWKVRLQQMEKNSLMAWGLIRQLTQLTQPSSTSLKQELLSQ